MSTTYEQRKKAGRQCVTVWLSQEAAEALDLLADGKTKRDVLERLLLREAKAQTMLDGVRVSPQEHREPAARAMVEDGTPAALARRVLEKGRREAIVVKTGRRVLEGRERR